MGLHSRFILPFFLIPAVGLFAVMSLPGGSAPVKKRDAQAGAIRLPSVCGTTLQNPRLDGSLPEDVEGALRQANRSVVQRASDIFSWQEFLALNWPAVKGLRGKADLKRPISAPGPRVWETWKETKEVYKSDGSLPPAWNSPSVWPVACKGFIRKHKAFLQGRYAGILLNASLQAVEADGTLPASLTDQNGHLVRYEVRMNRVLFEYIRAHKLYDGRVQATQEAVSFPSGSILIKAAWREVSPIESTRFLTTDAWIYDLKEGIPTRFRRRRMGLVGFHIMHKTPSASQWIWSTFEHLNNVSGSSPAFRSASKRNLIANAQTLPGIPNRVTRVTPIPEREGACMIPSVASDNVRDLNRAMQRALREAQSVLRYYELVNTQWPLPPEEHDRPLPVTVFRVLPTFLANTTMETFTQETSSCMGCHASAHTNRAASAVASDFTFTLSNARPTATKTEVLAPPVKPRTTWDRQNWRSVMEGRELTEHTYERLPGYVNAKLHCGSCHLQAGRDPAASWWVGMIAKYKYPATDKLSARINQCFERSMNGTALPVSPSSEASAPEMHSFIAYMQWLDEQYEAAYSCSPTNGLPAMEKMSAEAPRGQDIFLQKCAVCHGKKGQGRYASNTYFRPALWGIYSFNARAGLGKAEKLAAFLKSSMPYGSGGLLTVQEVWDLAAFLGNQQRPGK